MFLALCISEKPLYIALHLYTTHKCCKYWTELAITKQKLYRSNTEKQTVVQDYGNAPNTDLLLSNIISCFFSAENGTTEELDVWWSHFVFSHIRCTISKNVLQLIDSKSSTDLLLLTLKSIEPLFKPISHICLYLKLIKVEKIKLLVRSRILAVCSPVNRLHFYVIKIIIKKKNKHIINYT